MSDRFRHTVRDNSHANDRRPNILKNLDYLARKPALWKFGGSLHEQNNRIFRDKPLNPFASIRHSAGSSQERRAKVPAFTRLI